MSLVPGICTQCGSTLSVDLEKDAMVCPYCGTPFIVEKAVQTFNNTYTYNITNNITAENVIIKGQEDNGFDIVAGLLKSYNGAGINVEIPDDVITIGDNAFQSLQIKSITMPNSITKIGKDAFRDCNQLGSVKLSSNLLFIESGAFAGCTALDSLTLPTSMTYIYADAFENVPQLKLTLPRTAEIFMAADEYSPYYEDAFECDSLYVSSELLDTIDYFPAKAKKIYLDDKEITEEILSEDDELAEKLEDTVLSQMLQDIADKRLKEQSQTWSSMNLVRNRKASGLCPYCGGKFKGIAKKICSNCGREKDY